MIAVADTSPLNYLILIGEVEILPQIFGSVLIPRAVDEELCSDDAPEAVRIWIKNPPEWLETQAVAAAELHEIPHELHQASARQ